MYVCRAFPCKEMIIVYAPPQMKIIPMPVIDSTIEATEFF
jgi:hypothetical protein